MFAAEIEAKNIIASIEVGPDYQLWKDVTLLADVSRLSQIIINLITNAIKVS